MRFFKTILPRWSELARQARSNAPVSRGQRRATRVEAAEPVFVYGRTGGEPFAECATTLNVSVNGGCVVLSAAVERSGKMIVTNAQTNEDLPCRVARFSGRADGKVVVGLEFLEPHPQFWGIEFEARA